MKFISQVNHVLSLLAHGQRGRKTNVKIRFCRKIQKFLYFLAEEGLISGFDIINPWEATVSLKYNSNGAPAFQRIQKIAFQKKQITNKAYRLVNANQSRTGILIVNSKMGVTTDKYAVHKKFGGHLVAILT